MFRPPAGMQGAGNAISMCVSHGGIATRTVFVFPTPVAWTRGQGHRLTSWRCAGRGEVGHSAGGHRGGSGNWEPSAIPAFDKRGGVRAHHTRPCMYVYVSVIPDKEPASTYSHGSGPARYRCRSWMSAVGGWE